ncbi:hypothetical protein TNCV_608281 [Trichonephila clavipes]|nr:hypothetical protein TNCV_608281 [Trichonephila clavipes]
MAYKVGWGCDIFLSQKTEGVGHRIPGANPGRSPIKNYWECVKGGSQSAFERQEDHQKLRELLEDGVMESTG